MKQKERNILKMKSEYDERGICGKKAPFQDSNGDSLYTGDIVILINKKTNEVHGQRCIVEYENQIFVMGIISNCPRYEENWEIYKEKSYMSVKDGDVIDSIEYYKETETEKEMTIDEIEKELGYPIKIVKEEK